MGHTSEEIGRYFEFLFQHLRGRSLHLGFFAEPDDDIPILSVLPQLVGSGHLRSDTATLLTKVIHNFEKALKLLMGDLASSRQSKEDRGPSE